MAVWDDNFFLSVGLFLRYYDPKSDWPEYYPGFIEDCAMFIQKVGLGLCRRRLRLSEILYFAILCLAVICAAGCLSHSAGPGKPLIGITTVPSCDSRGEVISITSSPDLNPFLFISIILEYLRSCKIYLSYNIASGNQRDILEIDRIHRR